MEAFMSHDAARGAMPTLRAATAKDAPSGRYFAPEHMFQLKGDPVPAPIPKPAQDVAAALQLWETAESLTGAAWRVVEPPPCVCRAMTCEGHLDDSFEHNQRRFI